MSAHEDLDFQTMLKENVWHSASELRYAVDEILKLAQDLRPWSVRWLWSHHPDWNKVKYIKIKIDMRDGGFVIQDDSGSRISLEHLAKQRDKNGK